MNIENDNFNQFKNPSPYQYSGAQVPTKFESGYAMEPTAASNGWGLAGFITSLIGLLLCGIPSVIGLIFSLIGMTKKPKGFAIAGLLIGLVGLVELGLVIVLTISAVREVKSATQSIASVVSIGLAGSEVQAKWRENSKVPSQEEGDEIISGKTDHFGQQLIYEPKEDSFSIRSRGKDGSVGTSDDIVIPFFSAEDAKSIDLDNFEITDSETSGETADGETEIDEEQ